MSFLGHDTYAAFLAACDDVRLLAVEQHRTTDTPAVIARRQSEASRAASIHMPWENR